uniref:Uncharacterized protein n=1 Tax=Anguilla anguilla TaxID=7936 RepID=A0A0E9VEU9_ANGAN
MINLSMAARDACRNSHIKPGPHARIKEIREADRICSGLTKMSSKMVTTP